MPPPKDLGTLLAASVPLQCVKDSLAEQRKACLTIALSFDQFQLGHVSLDHAVIDPPGETSSHRIFVFLDPSGKGLQFGKIAAFHLVKPGIEVLSRAGAQHLGKLLNQVIGQINFRVDLTELAQASLAPRRAVFQGDEERGRRLVVKDGRAGATDAELMLDSFVLLEAADKIAMTLCIRPLGSLAPPVLERFGPCYGSLAAQRWQR